MSNVLAKMFVHAGENNNSIQIDVFEVTGTDVHIDELSFLTDHDKLQEYSELFDDAPKDQVLSVFISIDFDDGEYYISDIGGIFPIPDVYQTKLTHENEDAFIPF